MLQIHKYIRIALACVCAFFISSFLFSHYFSTSIEFDAVALKKDTNELFTAVTSFRVELPRFDLISQNTESAPEPEAPQETVPSIGFESVPTTPPELPTSTPFISRPTVYKVPSLFPSRYPQITSRSLSPSPIPTSAPAPTKKPKPTKAPDTFPIDPAKARPGTTVDEIIAQAAAKACVPKEFLRTIASIESGGFFDTVTPRYLLLYNSENWWNSEFITGDDEGRKRVCSGYGYDSNIGLVFPDSKHAGEVCRPDSGSGLTTAGVMHLSTYMNNKFKDKAGRLVGSKVADRRIIFDALVMSGLIAKENTKASTCTNWDARTLVKAACGHYGSCGVKDGTYYCATFCRNITKYGGKSCAGAIAEFAETCWK